MKLISKDQIYTGLAITALICVFVLIGMAIILSLNINILYNNNFIIIGFTAIILLCLSLAFLEDGVETENEIQRTEELMRYCREIEGREK